MYLNVSIALRSRTFKVLPRHHRLRKERLLLRRPPASLALGPNSRAPLFPYCLRQAFSNVALPHQRAATKVLLAASVKNPYPALLLYAGRVHVLIPPEK